MKCLKKHLSPALAPVLRLSFAVCGKSSEDYIENNEDYDDDGSDYDLYSVPDPFEGLVKGPEQMADLYLYGGAWAGENGDTLVAVNNDEGDEVCFALHGADEDMTASGFIQFVPDYDYDHFYNEYDGMAYRSWFDEDGVLYVVGLGIFTQVTGDAPGENIGDGDYGFFAGVWCQGDDPDAVSIIRFDASGSWELLERPGDDGDPTMVDCGTIEVDQSGVGQYFTISTIHTDAVYDFTPAGGGVAYWGGEYGYYQKIE